MTSKEIVENYYRGIELHLNHYKNVAGMEGRFSFEKLQIGMTVPSDTKAFLDEIYKADVNTVYGERVLDKSLSEVEHLNQAAKTTVEYIQIIFHEALHTLQSYTLQACNEYTYWIRHFVNLEFAVVPLNIGYGGHWKFREKLINDRQWEWILKEEDWIDKEIRKYHSLTNQIRGKFTLYSKKRLCTLDLVEGEAFAFQELTTDSINRLSQGLQNDSVYKKAFHYFVPNPPDNLSHQKDLMTVFILCCHLSLRFGTSRYNDEKREATEIFEHLCENKQIYLMSFSKSFEGGFEEQEGFNWLKEHEYDKKLDQHQISHFLFMARLIDQMINDILRYFRVFIYSKTHMLGKEKKFYDQPVLHMDRKMKPLNEYYVSQIPGFRDRYFIALLMSGNFEIVEEFTNVFLDSEIDQLELKAPTGRIITMEQDYAVSEIIADFRQYVKYGKCICCPKHGLTNNKVIINSCIEPTSLRISLKELYGAEVELGELVY